jgi:hypothetical protein
MEERRGAKMYLSPSTQKGREGVEREKGVVSA